MSLFGPPATQPEIVVYIDGGARGNPGPAGYGVRVERPDGTLVEEFGGAIGVATNNVAEYRGLLAALEWARAHGHRAVHVRSDSQLLVQQMIGNYKVKNPGLQPLHAEAHRRARDIGRVSFEHVARALNAHADRLANAAMDDAQGAAGGRAAPPAARGSAASGVVAVARPGADARQPSADPLSPLERQIRAFVYEHFVETGRAPDVAAIGAETSAPERAVVGALRQLAELHALVLAPATTNIWMAHPFSATATAYPVSARGRTYFANCAWDAAGILSLLGDGESTTVCQDCGSELRIAVRGGEMTGDGVVHYLVPPRRFWENVAFT